MFRKDTRNGYFGRKYIMSDLIAYSETYKNIVEYNDSLNKETGKGSK